MKSEKRKDLMLQESKRRQSRVGRGLAPAVTSSFSPASQHVPRKRERRRKNVDGEESSRLWKARKVRLSDAQDTTPLEGARTYVSSRTGG